MKHGIELDREVCSVYQFAQLDYLTKGHFVAYVKAGHLNELIVRFIRQVENFTADVDAVDKPAEIQKIQDLKRSFDIAKVKDNTGS